jgi:hypothetical protein
MVYWVGAISSFLSAILGAGVMLLVWWLDMRKRYHASIFPKRLEIHQEAFAWRTPLLIAISSQDTGKIMEVTANALKWWDNNCLYLDEKSRQYFHDFIVEAKRHAILLKASPRDPSKWADDIKELWKKLDKTFNAITDGVGAKYLPDMYNAMD